MRLPVTGLLLLLAACQGDETVRAYGAAGRVWTLAELDGTVVSSRATLTFPEPGRIAGDAPCGSYSAKLTAPYPWFETTGLNATGPACPAQPDETAFLAALAGMTLSEVLGNLLILRNDAGREMVFRSSG